MHDRLFSDPKRADLGTLITHGEAVRLDLQTFEDCMRGGTRGRIDADVAEATALGVTGTPTFFLGIVEPDGRVRVVERIAGARPFPVFTDAIDRLLNDAAVPKGHSERDTKR
jgi:predicted DsbA family dithiol-disulfide isomerase